jgi:hypothetical protein
MQNVHNHGFQAFLANCWRKKPALTKAGVSKREMLLRGYFFKDVSRAYLGHENSNERQQKDQNCASDRNHDRNVLHDTFNRILGFV